MQIDHVVPEHLLEKPEELKSYLEDLGLPADFKLNSYENWLPSCANCNNAKRGSKFKPAPIYLASLERASKKADKCRKIAAATVRDADIAKALSYLERAAASETNFDYSLLKPLFMAFCEANPEAMRAMHKRTDPGKIEFITHLEQPPELAIAPNLTVRFGDGIHIVTTPLGTGYVPKHETPHSSFYCGSCGSLGPWNGARCLSCGMLNDD
ncbi:hypothetical protein [Antarcticirhabdus aurantiaca]|uniref:Uncharacterized protein n=1 Tax=Antarcticirhabdus aurantiaca TaxID=2606717 RepID=A0ACD4NN25_9HYPH|nr:hypothetical protein [Antarcticirhabdus aurantiaca]WAJ28036.1 hypothetical protein OXU80_24950 [Jeongeuplla avenae]